MHKKLTTVICVLLVCSSALADISSDEATKASGFNDAWIRYTNALQKNDNKLRLSAAKEVLDSGRVIFGDTHTRTPTLLMNYGAALNAVNRRNEAREVLQESLDLSEAIHGDDSVENIIILAHLADANANRDRPSTQLKIYKQALGIAKQTHGEESDYYAKLALRAGMNSYQLSRSVDGQKHLRVAADHFAAKYGESSFEAGLAQYYLGKVDFSNRNYKAASKHLLHALLGFDESTKRGVEYQLYARALLVEVLEYRNMSAAATEHCVAIGRLSPLRAKADFVPLFRMAPRYPSAMLARRKEGIVDVEFTVDKSGIVRDAEIISDGDSSRGFEEAALAAVDRFRYAPRVVDGEAVMVDGVKTRISFKLR